MQIPRPESLANSRLELVPGQGKSNPIAADFKRNSRMQLSAYAVRTLPR
jgi:hypothetical protein